MTDLSERVQQFQREISQRATTAPEETPEATLAVLTFQLSGERYALPLTDVSEVSRPGSITPIPGLPPVVLGAVGLRGEVVPVLDLRRLLQLEPGPLTSQSRLVIVQHKGAPIALQADRVEDIAVLPTAALRPPPDDVPKSRAPLLRGIAGEGTETTRLLDLTRLLEAVDHGD